MKKTACLLTAAMIALTSLAGCGQQDTGTTKNADGSTASSSETNGGTTYTGEPAFAKFDEPVDIHIGMPVNPGDKSLPEGDTVEDNQYTRYLKENYNINVVIDWTAAYGGDYNQKVSLAIASDTLPDAVLAYDPAYINKAVEAGLLYDMTDIWEKYASKQVKGIIDSGERMAMDPVTFDGRMYGLPGSGLKGDGVFSLTVRQDWLDAYGLEEPKTLDDVENIARVFKEKDPAGGGTIPLIGPSKSSPIYTDFLTTTNWGYALNPVFNAYDVYPGYWIENEDGSVTYGSTDQNMKKALERLSKWYEEGLLDPEMGTRDNSYEPVSAGKVGMFFGNWSSMGYGNYETMLEDPNADWQCYPIYDDNGKWNTGVCNPYQSAMIVNRNVSEETAHALMILYNVCCRDEANFDVSVDFNLYPLRLVISAYDEVEYTYNELYKILDGTTQPEDYKDPDSIYKLMYADSLKIKDAVPGYESGREVERKDLSMDELGDFMRYYSCLIAARPLGKYTLDKEVPSVTYVLSETMEKKWTNLKKLEDETILKIILGQQSIDTFDQFVEDWYAQGGSEIIAEVEEIAKQK